VLSFFVHFFGPGAGIRHEGVADEPFRGCSNSKP